MLFTNEHRSGQLAILLLASLGLLGCEQDMTDVNLVGYVDVGPLGPNAKLTEICVDGLPYYYLISSSRTGKAGNKSALALRVDADGTMPDCAPDQTPWEEPIIVKAVGYVPPERRLSEMCINGVIYLMVDSMYTGAIAPKITRQGTMLTCSQ